MFQSYGCDRYTGRNSRAHPGEDSILDNGGNFSTPSAPTLDELRPSDVYPTRPPALRDEIENTWFRHDSIVRIGDVGDENLNHQLMIVVGYERHPSARDYDIVVLQGQDMIVREFAQNVKEVQFGP